MNLFCDNEDLQFHFKEAIRWRAFVPLWEEGFASKEGPRDLAEALDIYRGGLTEVGRFAADEIAPVARQIDEEGVVFKDGKVVLPSALSRNIEGLRKLGVMAVSLPRDVGGLNFPFTVGAALLEILSRACTNTMLLYAFYQGPAALVFRFGTAEQVNRWVRPLADGEISGAVAMTEPEAGSDLGNVQTMAAPTPTGWSLRGRKQFITNGCGDMCVVLARTQPGSNGLEGLSLLIVPRVKDGRQNYRVARPERKFVIRGSATCELAFEDSSGELLGQPGAGFDEILTFMNESRIAVAIQALGICEAAFRSAATYASGRVQMNRPIARHELIADLLLDMEAEIAAIRGLVYECTQLRDQILGLERAGKVTREAARLRWALRERTPLLKWLAAERALWITRMAVQIHGGYGVVQEFDVERHYRDALILPIYEGTSQIQALMSFKDQLKRAFREPWRLLDGPCRVEAPANPLGDALRDMASEYNRAFKFALAESLGPVGALRALLGRGEAHRQDLSYAFLSSERLVAMLAYTRAAEAMVGHAAASAKRRQLAERLVHRFLPEVRMAAEIVCRGDRSTLEALQA